MITMDDKELRKYERDLNKFKQRAYPFATKATVNGMAFQGRRESIETISNKMVLKNTFTKRSIRVEQTATLNVKKQEAILGSTEKYMEEQEFGAVKNKTGKHGVAITTGYAAGQENQKRTKVARKANKLPNIRLNRTTRAKTRKQQTFIAIQEAAKSSNKYVFLSLGKTKGIFKVVGGKKKPKIKMVYSLKKSSVVIPKNPWLKPSVDKTIPKGPGIYKKALEFQLKRHNLFKG